MSDKPQIVIRDCKETDVAFVLNSYLRSYRDAPLNRMLSDRSYYKHHVERINDLMQSTTSRIKLAVNPDHPDQIYGYIWYFETDDAVFANWVYIKLPFRRFGVATMLVAQLPTKKAHYTHFNENWAFFRRYGADYLPWYYFTKGE